MESISQKEHAAIEFLVQNSEPLKEKLRPLVQQWKDDEHLYVGMEFAFKAGYRNWLLNRIYDEIIPGFNLTYEEAAIILDWSRLASIWILDEKGYF